MFHRGLTHNAACLAHGPFIKQEVDCCRKRCNRQKTTPRTDCDFDPQPVTEFMSPSHWSVRRHTARCHAFVNERRSSDWWDVSNYTIPFAREDVMIKCDFAYFVGSGRYGAVYKAYFYEDYEEYDIKKEEKYVIKVLKPDNPEKIKKEIKILTCLLGGPHIVRLHTVLQSHIEGQFLLVMEAAFGSLGDIWPVLSRQEVRGYMYQLLQALDYSHRNGIMHRDIKPQNIVIDPRTQRLLLVDWGIADFYFPRQEYQLRSGTLPYKAPELLLGYKMLDYAIDMWAFSCILAGFLFRTMPFFRASSPELLLLLICRFLGTRSLLRYIDKYDISAPRKAIYQAAKVYGPARPPLLTVEGWTSHLLLRWGVPKPDDVSRTGFHLLLVTMRFDHHQRLSAAEAMAHPFFRGVRPAPNRLFDR